MSEHEMRELLHVVCANLDRRARALGRTLKKSAVPIALGTGLALSASACGDSQAAYGVPPPHEAGVDAHSHGADLGPQPAYMAPPFEMGLPSDITPAADLGPQPAYMAPDSMTSDSGK